MPDAKMSTLNFGTAVKKFADAGLSQQFLIPVVPPGSEIAKNATVTPDTLGKVPGRYNPTTGTWSGLFGDILTRGVTRDEAKKFLSWPTNNIGLLGAAYPAIDSDAQSPEAADVVHAAVKETFAGLRPAVRLRGANDRLLYAFKARDWKNDPVRTRHVSYRIGGIDSGIDFIGCGNQYLIAGTHPLLDTYEWQEGDELHDNAVLTELAEFPVDNVDFDRFLVIFERLLEKAGGEITNKRGKYINGGNYDPTENDPALSVDDIFAGLARLPNTVSNFEFRDDLIGVLSAVRAAAGRDGASQDFEDRVRAWAVDSSEGFCTEEYFDKIWDSLRTVRVSRGGLERIFRENRIFHTAGHHFDDRGPELSNGVKEAKATAKDARAKTLDKFAARFVLGSVNVRDDKNTIDMRWYWNPLVSWDALAWWNFETEQKNDGLIEELHTEFGDKKVGFWTFMRALKEHRAEAFFISETRNPNYGFGEIVPDEDADTGIVSNLLNMAAQSAVIRAAGKADPDPERSRRDVASFLEFGERLFEKMWAYELDTLAYMAQTGKRPGHMLVMVGDSGVGKSIYGQIQTKIFNGSNTSGVVDGAKLYNEGAARFAFAGVEGCRIISVRELPKGNRRNSATMNQVTSTLKQMVDAGPEGDFFTIEDKSTRAKRVKNFARIIASSNHSDAIEIEDGDRRIFLVNVAINHGNKPDESYYGTLVDIIADPVRLASIYRYLQTHDISRYSVNTPPPVSLAKAEQQTMKAPNATERHMRAAITWFECNEVVVFDSEDLTDAMTMISEYEAENLGNGDKKVEYTEMLFGTDKASRMEIIRAMAKIKKLVYTLSPTRTLKDRDPTQFVTLNNKTVFERLDPMSRGNRLPEFDDLRTRAFRLSEPHPWAQFRKGGA